MNDRKCWSLAAVAGVVVLAQQAAAHPACPGNGDCCQHNGSPGCDDVDCCNLICDIDPWCCDLRWDAICAGSAADFCPGCPSDPCASDDDCLPDEVCIDGDCVDAGCPLDCPSGALEESEPCGSDTNGGCFSSPPVFTPAACGDTLCGTAWTYLHTRDLDWYVLDHDGGTITATLISQFYGDCLIVGGVGPGGEPCDPIVVGSVGAAYQCQNLWVASADLPPGTVVIVVSVGGGNGIPANVPCGGANDYVLSIDCGPCIGDCAATPDGIVGNEDLLTLLAQWGTPGSCDFNGDGVGVTDFLMLLNRWGACHQPFSKPPEAERGENGAGGPAWPPGE